MLRLCYRVEVRGTIAPHPRLLIVCNHQSFLDAVVLGSFLAVRPVWVVHSAIAARWYFQIGLRFIPHVTLDTAKPIAMKTIVGLVEQGLPVLIFPEGRITETGRLMKIYEGPAMVALRTGATVVPVHIEGPVYSWFSRMSGDWPRRPFPRVRVNILPPTSIETPPVGAAKVRRRIATEQLRRIMQEGVVEARPRTTLFEALLDAVALHGRGRRQMEDARGKEETYGQLIRASLALGRIVAKMTRENERVAVLMPNLNTTVGLLFGLPAMRRVPAMLNYTAGYEAMQAACRLAGARVVLTSRAFLEKARLTEMARRLEGVRLVYLEDVRSAFGLRDKLWLLAALRFPQWAIQAARPEDPAVILFTSGSEGKPKGVALSHESILANVAQLQAVVEFTSKDKFLSALPLFHAFGLTAGAMAPLLSGARVFLYPTPLHYRMIPEIIYDRNCTVLFATGTFLAHYGRFANSYDFRTLRLIAAGAEKLSEDVRKLYNDKFGIRLIEGYGATECSPVIACNSPKAYRPGTVGELLPGMEYRVVPVAGIEEGGMLHVKGPNVMLGYLRPDGSIEPVQSECGEGWYATGDVVSVEDRAVTILGRMRRFAKVAGEMVSLELAEKIATAASPNLQHASAAVPQPGRGEMILLFTQDPDLRRDRLLEAARAIGAPEIAVPRRIVHLPHLPLLGNGKKDHVQLDRMALTMEAAATRPS